MRTLPDERLYRDTAHCLAFLRGLTPTLPPSAPVAREPFHFYWHGRFGRKTAFALKSFLATQDLTRVEAWLWLDAAGGEEDAAANEHLRPLLPHIRLLRYDPLAEARGTPLDGATELLTPVRAVPRSDAFRLLALYHHGGTYVDMDTMFLRDFQELFRTPFGTAPFCYRWSAHVESATNAVMRAVRASPLLLELMRHCRRIGSCATRQALRHADHPGGEIMELPCPFFDPLWPHTDKQSRYREAPFHRFRDFFRPFGWFFRPKPWLRSIADFFPGAFAYQWHGLWRAPECEDSYFGRFERELDMRLTGRDS